MTALEEIKKALEGVGPLKVEFTPDCDEFNAIIAPINEDYDGTFFTVIGCGDKQDKLGGFMAIAVNAMPELLSTLESLQRENERLQAEIDRKSSMPGDHRYWEGRYRDEAAENEKLREALTPFVLAFESRRETYSKRYRSNRQLGYANFDKMPDDWAMEKVAFNMGTYRCARKALSSAGRDPLREFDALVEGPSFTEIASTGGEHHAE